MASAVYQKLIPSIRAATVMDGTKNKVNVAVVLFSPKSEAEGDVNKTAAVAAIQIIVAKAIAKQTATGR